MRRWARARDPRCWVLLASFVSMIAPFVATASDEACHDSFQGKRIRWISGGNPGSTADVYSRLIAPHYVASLGAEVVFETHSGASGLVAMKEIEKGAPDGTTIALIGGPQTLIGAMHGRLPDPGRELHVLGQASGSRYVWATGRDSELRSMEDVYRAAAERPVLFSMYEPKGNSFLRGVTVSRLLGIDARYVTGYRGSSQLAMAAVRGEVDLVSIGVDGKVDLFANGDLRPLMDLNPVPIDVAGFGRLPDLFGSDGVAVRRARELGRDPDETAADLAGLAALLELGRIFVTPSQTDPALVQCMRATLAAAFEQPAFVKDMAASGLPFAGKSADETIALIDRARERLPRFQPAVDAAVAELSR